MHTCIIIVIFITIIIIVIIVIIIIIIVVIRLVSNSRFRCPGNQPMALRRFSETQ